MVSTIRNALQPIADWFAGFGVPAPIVHWGHPLMMGIVLFVMGSVTAWVGWQGRLSQPGPDKAEKLAMHKRLAPWLFIFISLGYTGGVLSLVMQDQPIFESPHFWTGTTLVSLLALNGAISASKFAGGQASLRSAHAYVGSVAVVLMVIHAVLGLRLGLAI